MKEAKRQKDAQSCGNCAKTIRLRHDHDSVACTAHLTVVSVDHAADCGEFEAHATGAQVPAADAGAQAVPPGSNADQAHAS